MVKLMFANIGYMTLILCDMPYILSYMSAQPEYFLWDVERYHRAIKTGVFTKLR